MDSKNWLGYCLVDEDSSGSGPCCWDSPQNGGVPCGEEKYNTFVGAGGGQLSGMGS